MSQPQTIGPENHLKHDPFIKTKCLHAMTLAFHPIDWPSRNKVNVGLCGPPTFYK